jgi:pimeloyl-ACP methyl ester carboxylesterase
MLLKEIRTQGAIVKEELAHRRIAGRGVELHVVVGGAGPPVILLHGFPENWNSWHRQIPRLAAAGFSVWVPDLRGYNLSDRPREKNAYELDNLVADVVALVKATGYPRAHIVGHDWGGIIAWAIAERFPALVNRLVILNAPHLKLYLEKVKCPRQMLRSWYVLFFQIPKLPEFALAANNFNIVRDMFRLRPCVKTAFSDSDIELYSGPFSARSTHGKPQLLPRQPDESQHRRDPAYAARLRRNCHNMGRARSCPRRRVAGGNRQRGAP